MIAQWLYLLSIETARTALLTPMSMAMAGVLFVMMAALVWIRDRRINIALLVLLILRYLVIYAL